MNKISRLAKDIITSNFTDLKLPYRFTYILTYRCQLKCNMCNIWQRPVTELSLEEIKNFFDRSNRFSWINLSGGEIFLRKDLADIFEIILNKCRHLYLLDFPTNGFQTELIVSSIKKILGSYCLPKLLVTVSLDGPPELHDKIRGISGGWEKATETFNQLRRLRNKRFGVFLGMTLQVSNLDKIQETFEAVNKKIGRITYNDFHVNMVQYSPHYYMNESNLNNETREALQRQLRFIIKLRRVSLFNPVSFMERRYQRLAEVYLDKNKTPLPCQALSASFFMDPDGNVYPCSVYNRKIGNIRDFDYNIYELWENASRRKLREDIRQGNCPHCWTPCEAYQSILGRLLPGVRRR